MTDLVKLIESYTRVYRRATKSKGKTQSKRYNHCRQLIWDMYNINKDIVVNPEEVSLREFYITCSNVLKKYKASRRP